MSDMSDSDDSTTSVPQLTSLNYAVWKQRVIPAIGSKSVEATLILQGKIPAPDKKNTEEFMAWTKNDFIAKNIIYRGLDDATLLSMKEHATSNALWEALKECYEKVDRSQLLAMQREFLLLKQGRTQSFQSFLDQIESLRSRIAATGHPLSNEQVLQTLIYGLNSDFALCMPTLDFVLNNAMANNSTGPDSEVIDTMIGTIRIAEQQVNAARSSR